jgi:mercuric ion transport protein
MAVVSHSREVRVSAASDVKGTNGKGTGVVTGAGLAAGVAAIIASSCCVLPIVFVGFGLGSVAALLIPTLATLRPYLLAGALLAVVTAWILYARRRPACSTDALCASTGPARRAPVWLVLASAIVLLALIWQRWIEPLLLPWLR